MEPISSCVPAEIAESQYDAAPMAEDQGEDMDRRIETELAYLIADPAAYCERADDDIFYMLVRILTDGEDDKIGRCRDVLDRDMKRVATEAANDE